jgi:hypothetical protein
MASVGTELINEIERVAGKRARYEQYANDLPADCRAGMALSIAVMTAALQEAKEALRGDDPVRAIRAMEALKDYSDDD